MAHKKGGGSSRNGRDSNAQRLGVKRSDGQQINAGSIFIRHLSPAAFCKRHILTVDYPVRFD